MSLAFDFVHQHEEAAPDGRVVLVLVFLHRDPCQKRTDGGEGIIFLDLSRMDSSEGGKTYAHRRSDVHIYIRGVFSVGAITGRRYTAWKRLPSARLQQREMGNSIIYQKHQNVREIREAANRRRSETEENAQLFHYSGC